MLEWANGGDPDVVLRLSVCISAAGEPAFVILCEEVFIVEARDG